MIGSLLAAALLVGSTGGGKDDTQVLLTKVQALRAVFPECEEAIEIRRLLEGDERARIERELHRSLEEKGFLVYIGLKGGAADGLAVITNEIGKVEPITFIVAANLDLSVRRVAVMVYRESHGDEVRARRFLVQFDGKRIDDPIELHRDVINVSGATLSATALCNGTRKALAALAELVPERAPAELAAAARAAGRPIALRESAEAPLSRPPSFIEARRLVMGSELRVVAYAPATAHGDGELGDAVQRALDAAERLDAVLSDWRDDSELSGVNRTAGGGPVAISGEMLDFLRQSGELSRATRGAFDPTIGALVRAWGFRDPAPRDACGRRAPADALLAELVAGCGFGGVLLDETKRTVAFTRPRIRLDPGAIGKGMAVDAVGAALRTGGITNAFVDFGSSQLAMGEGPEPGGRGWPVTIRNPFVSKALPDSDGAAPFITTLHLRDQACSTSGNYEKFVVIDGKQHSHVLDPRTGRPATTTASATVIAATGARSDALATALHVLGPEEGPPMLDAIADAAGLLLPTCEPASPIQTSRWPR